MEETRKVGRPSDYTKEMAELICQDISTGKSLKSICRDENRPAIATVFKWMRDYPEFLNQYDKACQDRIESQYEELNEINDEAIEYAKTSDVNVQAVMTAYKLKADNMKWSMARMKPKKFGDKQDVTSGGEPIMFLPTEVIKKLNHEITPETITGDTIE